MKRLLRSVRARCCLLPALLVLFATVMSGCRTMAPETSGVPGALQESGGAAEPEGARPLRPQVLPKADTLDESAIVVDEVAPESTTAVAGERSFPERRELVRPERPVAEYPENLIKGIIDPSEEVEVQLNLDATALTEVVPLFGKLLNFGYYLDPGVKGAVTMTVDTTMSAREVWEMFEHILWLAGAYASKSPGFINILPFAKMPTERRIFAKHDPVSNVEVTFIPIMYVKSAGLITNIKPFTTDGSSITDLPASNTLLIVEAPANMAKLRELIKLLDDRGEAAWPHLVFQCREVDAEEVKEELDSLLPVLGLPVTNQSPSGGQIKLAVIPRLQVIIASAAIRDVLTEVETWCKTLDQSDLSEKENLYFYNIKHAAGETPGELLSQALETFFNTSTTSSGRPSSSRSTSTRAAAPGATGSRSRETTTTRNSTDRSTRQTTPRRPASKPDQDAGKPATIFDTPVLLYVDEINSRLLVRTTLRAWSLIEVLLERLDVSPRQVMIEAIIADITLSEDTEFGFAYAARDQKTDDLGEVTDRIRHSVNNAGTWLSAEDGGIVDPGSIASGVAASLLKNKGDLRAFINAVAGERNVRVLSAPQVTAVSGEEASLSVGTRVSIRTTDYQDNASFTRATYQYEETGTMLQVTPHVTAGNEVRLQILQEVSDVVEDTRTDNGSPDITNKTIDTILTIPDGGTVMMGGLISTASSDGHSGIPFLKDIPGLGWFFRTHLSSSSRHELLVLITANVIDKNLGADQLAYRYQAALDEIRNKMEP